MGRRHDVKRNAEVAVLCPDFIDRGHTGEAGFAFELPIGGDDASDMLVGEETLCGRGDIVDYLELPVSIFLAAFETREVVPPKCLAISARERPHASISLTASLDLIREIRAQ